MKYLSPLLVIVLSLFFFSCGELNAPEGELEMRQGRLRVSRSLLESTPLMDISGEAGFYWGLFIDPKNPPPMTEYSEITEDWGGLYPEQGNASLRFIIEKDPLIDKLYISFNSIYSSYRMYINGELVSQSGRPSLESGRQQLAIRREVIVDYVNGDGPMDVVLHISNPYYHRNGIKGLRIGTPEALYGRYNRNLFYQSLTLGILMAMTLYHFVLVITKTNRSYILLFALLTLTITFRYLVVDSKLIFNILPQLSFSTYDRLQRLGIYPIAGFFITYVSLLYYRPGRPILIRIIQIGSILFSILSFLVPPQMVSGSLFTAFYPIFLLAIGHGLFIIIRAVIKKEEDAFPMAVGVIVLVLAAVLDMLVDRDIFPAYNVYHLSKGMIVFIFVQAYIISKRVNRAYINERRFREALQGVQSRLELTIEGAKLGLVEWDILHNTWYLNDNFSHMIGFKKDHLVFNRRHWLDLIHPEDAKEIDQLLKGALSGKIGNFRREYRLRMSGGSYRWCLLLGKVIQQNRLGGAEWFVGLHIDISDKKEN